jgi:carboxyl-terminal processing protease
MKHRILLLLALALAALMPLRAQTPAAKPGTDEAETRRRAFEKVWTTINEKHYDPTFGGVDWKKVRAVYEPLALAAPSGVEFHAVLRRMLGELKLSHFSVYAPEPAAGAAAAAAAGTIGAEIRMIDGRAFVFRLGKDSTAEKAGLKTGYALEKIDDRTVAEILAPLEKSFAERAVGESLKTVYRERLLHSALDGRTGSVVRLEIADAKNGRRQLTVERVEAKREMSEAFGNFPPQEVVFEARRLDGNVGYIRFNIWVVAQMPKIRQAIREFADAKGIVFDLRGNPGGIGGMAPGVAGLLMSREASLGSMTGRESEQKFIVFPQSNPFAGKVAILTDHGTASTSEVFAAGLQENGRAAVIGERSAGAVLPSIFELLPTGAIFQYAISDYKSPKNILIEGRGVVPDTEIKQTREALLEGRDLPLEAAVKQLTN